MKLKPVHIKIPVLDAHDLIGIVLSDDEQLIGQAAPTDCQRMIAGRVHNGRQAFEQRAPVGNVNAAPFPVDQLTGVGDLCAEGLTDGLMPEAHT